MKVYVKILFSIEERTLFPIILNNGDEAARSEAICFIADTEEMKDTYYKYNEKWVRLDLIQKDPDNFIKETRIIFDKFFSVFTKEKKFIRLISGVEGQNKNVYA